MDRPGLDWTSWGSQYAIAASDRHGAYRQCVAALLDTGEAVLDLETIRELPAQPGRVDTALTSFYPVRLDGEVIGIGIVVLDITERKQTEDALQNASKRDPQTARITA